MLSLVGGIGAALTVGPEKAWRYADFLLILPFYMPVLILAARLCKMPPGNPGCPYLAVLGALLCLAIAPGAAGDRRRPADQCRCLRSTLSEINAGANHWLWPPGAPYNRPPYVVILHKLPRRGCTASLDHPALAVAITTGGAGAGMTRGLLYTAPISARATAIESFTSMCRRRWVLAGYYVAMALAGAVSLIWKMKMADVAMKACSPTGAALTFIALVTGAIWGKPLGYQSGMRASRPC